jgi:hypothetical protein
MSQMGSIASSMGVVFGRLCCFFWLSLDDVVFDLGWTRFGFFEPRLDHLAQRSRERDRAATDYFVDLGGAAVCIVRSAV